MSDSTRRHGAPARRRRAAPRRPDRGQLVDAGFLLATCAAALLGLSSTYTGSCFAVVGVLGVVLGIVLVHVARALGWPAVAPVLLAVLAFFLLGGPLCLRAAGAVAPTPRTLGLLTDQLVLGWKDLLTTLPPVDGDGPAAGAAVGARPRRGHPRGPARPGAGRPGVAAGARVLPLAGAAAAARRRHPAGRPLAGVGVGPGRRGGRAGADLARPARAPHDRAGERGQRPGDPAGRRRRARSASRGRPPCRWAPGPPAARTPTPSGWCCAPTSSRPSTSAATPRRCRRSVATSRCPSPTPPTSTTPSLFTHRGRAGRHPRAHRHPRPLRRRRLGRLQRRVPRRHRRHLPAGRVDDRQPRRGSRPSTSGSPSARATPASGCRPSARCSRSTSGPADAPRRSATTSTAARASSRPGSAPGDRYTFTAVIPTDEVTADSRPSEQLGAHGRRRPPSSTPPPPSGPRAWPTRWSGSSRSPSTCARRASTPTACSPRERIYRPGHFARAPRQGLRQRPAHGRQRRAVRRGHGAAGQQGRRAGPRRPRRGRARRRGRPRPGRAGVGRAAGRRRVVAGAADRGRSWTTTSRRSSRPRPSSGSAAWSSRRRRRCRRPRPSTSRPTPRSRRARRARDAEEAAEDAGLPGWVRARAACTPAGRCSPCSWSPGRSWPPRRCAARRRRTAGPSSGRIAGAWRELVDHARDLGSAGAGRRRHPARAVAGDRLGGRRRCSRAPPTSASSGRPSRPRARPTATGAPSTPSARTLSAGPAACAGSAAALSLRTFWRPAAAARRDLRRSPD